MGSNNSRIIELTINKKLHSGFIAGCSREELFRFTRYCTSPSSIITEIMGKNVAEVPNDIYENRNYNFLSASPASQRNRFNVIRLFKPGEILNSLIQE